MSAPPPSAAPAKLPSFDSTLGALLIGSFVSAILYGILCLQTYMFFQRTEKEGRLMKYSVWALWIFNTLHLICDIHACYWFMVTNFADPVAIAEHTPWSGSILITFSVSGNIIVQTWFTWRIWILSNRNIFLTGILAVAVFCTWGFGFALSIVLVRIDSFADYATVNWFIYLVHSIDTVTNLALTATLSFLLSRMHRTPIRRTRSLVAVLIIYTVNTGLLGFIMILLTVLLRITQPNNLIFFAVYIPYSSLYSNGLLGSLNARDWMQKDTKGSVTIPLTSMNTSYGGGSVVAAGRMDMSGTTARATNYSGAAGSGLVVSVDQDVMKAEL